MPEDQSATSARSSLIAKAITLLELVASSADGVGVRDAARHTGIDRSAVGRILTQLEELDYVEQETERGVYSAGPRLFSVVAQLHERDSLAKAAEPFLRELVARFNETCYLGARVGDSVVFRTKVDCEHTIRYVIELGKPFFLVGGASGMAILTGLPEDEREELLKRPMTSYTPASFQSADEVRRQIEIDQELGYSYSPGRWVPNGGGIAAPFFDAAGRCVGAITLSSPMDRLQRLDIGEVGAAVRDAADRLSSRLGHTGPR